MPQLVWNPDLNRWQFDFVLAGTARRLIVEADAFSHWAYQLMNEEDGSDDSLDPNAWLDWVGKKHGIYLEYI